MHYKLSPETFQVRELFNPQLKGPGEYYYYILDKSGISHKEAVRRIGVRAWFCGIKDKKAHTKQWFCTNEKIDEISEEDFKIKYKGEAKERIHIGKHKGNAFTVIVELSSNEEKSLKHFKSKNELVCNYFGEQRFSENSVEIISALEKEDYEKALKFFLTKKSKMDSEKSTKIKEIISSNWGNWEKILNDQRINQTKKKELFEYLTNNPKNFLEAFDFVEPKSLRILLKAWQAKRFNEELNKLAKKKKPNNLLIKINSGSEEFNASASKAFLRKIIISPNEFEKKYRKGGIERKTFFCAEKFRARRIYKEKFELDFELARGCYATIFLKYLNAWLNNSESEFQKD